MENANTVAIKAINRRTNRGSARGLKFFNLLNESFTMQPETIMMAGQRSIGFIRTIVQIEDTEGAIQAGKSAIGTFSYIAEIISEKIKLVIAKYTIPKTI